MPNVMRKRCPETFSGTDLRALLPSVLKVFAHSTNISEIVAYCTRMAMWYRVTRTIVNGHVRYIVKALPN